MLYSYPDNGSGGYFIRKLLSHFKLSYANVNEECFDATMSLFTLFVSLFIKIITLGGHRRIKCIKSTLLEIGK